MHALNLRPQPKLILKGQEARQRLLHGAQVLAKAVSLTYGPCGRTVMLDRAAGLLATKDGVTVAREINLSDPVADLGCEILKVACVKVNDDAGDGTTSTAIIAAAVLEEGFKVIAANLDPMQVSRGVMAASRAAVSVIEDMAEPVESQELLERVAMIASNGDEVVSAKMAEACMAVGRDGTLTIEDGKSVGIELVFKEGMEIERGAASGVFLRNELERTLEAPLVAVIGATLKTVEDVQDIMEVASQWPKNHLLVFAEGIEGDALVTMTMNDSRDVMKCIAVPSPGFHTKKKDYLRDIAALAGADYIDPDMGSDFRSWDAEWFGSLRSATIRAKSSTLVAFDEASEVIQERIAVVRAEMAGMSSEYDIDRCNERIAKLSGGLCIMQVGGVTESEMRERRARIEDALGAVRAALEEGVIPGAGSSYLVASSVILACVPQEEDLSWQTGWKIMGKALQRPLWTLAENAGYPGSATVHGLLEKLSDDETSPWLGWDANTGGLRDLTEEPQVIDPTAVVRSVIEASASVAATLLTVETSIVVV